MQEIKFGYLPNKISCTFSSGKFYPVENFDETILNVQKSCHFKDGFLLSPTYKVVKDIENDFESPSFTPGLFRFFPTHILNLNESYASKDNYELNPTFFLLQLIGYVSGYRLMPEDYWFDLRIPQRPSINTLWMDKDLVKALDICLASWKSWIPSKRIAVTNLLFIFNRNQCYYWSFEQFAFEYKIIDSCYRVLHPDKWEPHGNRLNILLNTLEIREMLGPNEIKKIVDTRNDLVHELNWGVNLIAGNVKEEREHLTASLHRVNHRILGRLLGLSGSYFMSNPMSIGMYRFAMD